MNDPKPDEDGTLRLPPGDRSLAGAVLEGRDFMFAELMHVDMQGADFYSSMFHDARKSRAKKTT